jgi:hypothetical protein
VLHGGVHWGIFHILKYFGSSSILEVIFKIFQITFAITTFGFILSCILKDVWEIIIDTKIFIRSQRERLTNQPTPEPVIQTITADLEPGNLSDAESVQNAAERTSRLESNT